MTTVSSAEHTRRDFLYIATSAVGAVGAAAVLVPLIAQMNPDASTIAAGAPIEVDLAPIADGQIIKVFWRSKPIFVFHRTKKEIEEAQKVNVADLPDPSRIRRASSRATINGLSSSEFAPISAASRSPIKVNMTAGSARATARSTTLRAASAKVRPRKTFFCHPTSSYPTPRFRSAERNVAFKVQS